MQISKLSQNILKERNNDSKHLYNKQKSIFWQPFVKKLFAKLET